MLIPRSAHIFRKFIRGVFTYAVQAGYVNHNPTLKYSKTKKVKIRQFLTENQVSKFLQKAKDLDWEWYPVWLLAVYTGMRNGELFALKWKQVDFENSRILVNSSWNNKDGFKETKSGHDRWVSMPPHILTYLKEQKLKRDDSLFVLPPHT